MQSNSLSVIDVFEPFPCAGMITDLAGRILAINDDLLAVIGGAAQQWQQQNFDEIFPLEARIFAHTHVIPMLQSNGKVAEIFMKLQGTQNQMVPVMVNARAGRYHNVDCYYWVFFVAHERSRFEVALVQARQQAQRLASDLKKSNEFLKYAARIAGVGAWRLDLQSMKVEWSDQTCRIHEVPPGFNPSADEAISFYEADAQPIIKAHIQRAITDALSWNVELPLITAKQRTIWVRILGEPVMLQGKPVALAGAIQDITTTRIQHQKIRQFAFHDPLTGLPNSRMLTDRLIQALALAKRTGKALAVCCVDLDDFKAVNNTYGHDVADELLIEVARRLELSVRATDTVSRLGGDRFTLVFVNLTDIAEHVPYTTNVIAALGKPFRLRNDIEIKITASLGMALYPRDASDMKPLLHLAKHVMHTAKADKKSH
jgi:diguanylate cyclase (GGDEF)-like protein